MWKCWQKPRQSFRVPFGAATDLSSSTWFQPSRYVICLLADRGHFGRFPQAVFVHEPTSPQSGGRETYYSLYQQEVYTLAVLL